MLNESGKSALIVKSRKLLFRQRKKILAINNNEEGALEKGT